MNRIILGIIMIVLIGCHKEDNKTDKTPVIESAVFRIVFRCSDSTSQTSLNKNIPIYTTTNTYQPAGTYREWTYTLNKQGWWHVGASSGLPSIILNIEIYRNDTLIGESHSTNFSDVNFFW